MNTERRVTATLIFAALALSMACSKRGAETNVDNAVPVFIISIDTLRSDHLPAYGFASSTPALDAFRKDAVLFANAFSQCPQTLPSHASIMTGLLPARHAVRDNLGYVLRSAHPTIATVLKDHGYTTGAAVSTYVLRKRTGIAQGFDFFDDEVDYSAADSLALAERGGDRTRTVLEKWLDGMPGNRVFGFLHIYEPHAPYTPPAPFDRMKNPYDGEIAFADSIVGRFLQTLKWRGRYDDALIIILSDHGEGLGDHGEDEHGIFVYRESIQVPLMIKLPHQQRRGQTVQSPVGLVDVAPTIFASVGVSGPAAIDGRDILSKAIPGDRTIYSETYFPRLHLGWHELRSAIGSTLHFIDAPRAELYNHVADPGELRNVADVQRREVAAFRSLLQAHDAPLQPPSEVDPEDQRKLAALGYIGSTSSSEAELPDPKDRIGAVRQFRRAFLASRNGHVPEAITILETLLKADPRMVDAWGLVAQCYQRAGDRGAAIRSLKTAMSLFPHDPHVALALADLFVQSGQLDDAARHAGIAVVETPVPAHEMLAKIAIARGDVAAANREIQLALDGAPHRVETLLTAAALRESQHAYGDQLALLDRAAGEIEMRRLPPVKGLQADRGQALLQLGRGAEAEAAFVQETKLFPEELHPWAKLALLRAARGDHAGARGVLEEMVRMNPGREAKAVAAQAYDAFGDRATAARLRENARR